MELTGAFLEHLHREQQSNQRKFDLEKADRLLSKLFPQQRGFVEDKSRQKVALCPRRSGKSYSVLSYALITALRKPGAKVVVIAKVRRQVKGVYWAELKRICAHNEIKAHYRNVELECELENGSTILFTGADTMEEIEKFRGQWYDLACIDEGKSYSPYLLKELIQDVLKPALLDTRGTLVIIGTPGSVLAGPFFELTTMEKTHDYGVVRYYPERDDPKWFTEDGRRIPANWSLHRWHSKDNVYCPWIWEEAQNDKEQAGWSDNHPTWMREYLGQWVPDSDSMVYAYARSNKNGECDYTPLEEEDSVRGLPKGHQWEFVLGLDLGTRDDTAFVVCAWSDTHPTLFYVHAEKHVGWNIQDIVRRTKELESAYGGFMVRIADTGGLGVMVVESMAAIFGVDFIAAKKTEKASHIKLLNADFDSHRIKVYPNLLDLTDEWMTLQWADPEHTKEDPRSPNHCCDAALYIWRYCYHHLWAAREEAPTPGTPDWWVEKEKRDEEKFRDKLLADRDMTFWDKQRNEMNELGTAEDVWTSMNLKNWYS